MKRREAWQQQLPRHPVRGGIHGLPSCAAASTNPLIHFVEELALLVHGHHMPASAYRSRDRYAESAPPGRDTTGLWHPFAHRHAPSTVPKINNAPGINGAFADGIGAFVGVIVVFEGQLDAVFVKKRTPMLAYQVIDLSAFTDFIGTVRRPAGT